MQRLFMTTSAIALMTTSTIALFTTALFADNADVFAMMTPEPDGVATHLNMDLLAATDMTGAPDPMIRNEVIAASTGIAPSTWTAGSYGMLA